MQPIQPASQSLISEGVSLIFTRSDVERGRKKERERRGREVCVWV